MDLNARNIQALNENIKTQQVKITTLVETVQKLSSTVAILQAEMATTKQLAAYGRSTGSTVHK